MSRRVVCVVSTSRRQIEINRARDVSRDPVTCDVSGRYHQDVSGCRHRFPVHHVADEPEVESGIGEGGRCSLVPPPRSFDATRHNLLPVDNRRRAAAGPGAARRAGRRERRYPPPAAAAATGPGVRDPISRRGRRVNGKTGAVRPAGRTVYIIHQRGGRRAAQHRKTRHTAHHPSISSALIAALLRPFSHEDTQLTTVAAVIHQSSWLAGHCRVTGLMVSGPQARTLWPVGRSAERPQPVVHAP